MDPTVLALLRFGRAAIFCRSDVASGQSAAIAMGGSGIYSKSSPTMDPPIGEPSELPSRASTRGWWLAVSTRNGGLGADR